MNPIHRFQRLILFVFFLLFPSTAQTAGVIDVITPAWEGQTNEDGTGLFFEMLRAVYEPAGVAVRFRFAPWRRAQQTVAAGEADAMLCVWRVDAEEHGLLIPRHPMYVEYTAAVWKAGTIPDWKGVESLNGKRALWLSGYDFHTLEFFAETRFAGWDEVEEFKDAWRLLKHGRADVYIEALLDIRKFAEGKALDLETDYSVEILWGENAYPAFHPSKKSHRLMRIFDDQIQTLFADGRLKAMFKKWGAIFEPHRWESPADPPKP
ncbi:MAG: substrate-binding periplasmic protein [Desulfococcaceae bacterium]